LPNSKDALPVLGLVFDIFFHSMILEADTGLLELGISSNPIRHATTFGERLLGVSGESLDVSLTFNEDLEISVPSHENLGESFTNDNLGGAAYCLDSNEDLGVLSILLSTARFHGEIETTSCNSLETAVSIAFPAILGDRLSGIFCSPVSLTSVDFFGDRSLVLEKNLMLAGFSETDNGCLKRMIESL